MVELELVLGLVEVEFATWNVTGAELAGWDLADISLTSFTILWKSIGEIVLGIVSELDINVHGALTALVLVDVVLALITTAALDLDTQLSEESGDILHELDCLLPGTDVLVDLVEQVVQATTRELQTAFSIATIVGVFIAIVVELIPWAVESSLQGTGVGSVMAGVLDWWLLWVGRF